MMMVVVGRIFIDAHKAQIDYRANRKECKRHYKYLHPWPFAGYLQLTSILLGGELYTGYVLGIRWRIPSNGNEEEY